MERLDRDNLLKTLDEWWADEWNLKGGMIRALFLKGKIEKGKEITAESELRSQAYQQLRELVQCEDMVQQYRDEKEAEQAEIELCYIDIILDLYDQLEKKKPEVTKEWIRGWAQLLEDDDSEGRLLLSEVEELLKQMLKEAGVEVK